jgi:hypothetical protein
MSNLGGFYYASCVAHLTLRFDETLEVLEDRPTSRAQAQAGAAAGPAGSTSPGASAATGAGLTPVAGSTAAAGRPGPDRQAPADLRPLVFPQDDPYTQIMNRVPMSGSFELTGTRQAWTFDMEFDFRDLPIDPRVIRGMAVDVHLGTVDPDQFAAGMAGRLSSFGQLQSILRTQSDFTGTGGRTRQIVLGLNRLMTGSADTWRVVHGDQGSRVHVRGRDVRGILIDAKVDPKLAADLDLTKPIDRVVADILELLPVENDTFLTVRADPSEWRDGRIPSPGTADGLTRVRRGAAGDKSKSTPASGSEASYWDLITQYSNLVGGIPHLLGRKLMIRPAHAIHERVLGRTEDGRDVETPFDGGAPRRADGEEVRVRRLTYGRDVKELEFERKFAGQNVPLVEVVSIDDRVRGAGKLLRAQWPRAESRAASLKADTEVLRIPVPGVRDLERLEAIAQSIYEEVGRGEMGGRAKTQALASFGGDNADPDMLRLRPTDAIELTVDARALSSRAPAIADLVLHERRAFAEEVEEVAARMGDRVLARVLVAVSRGAVAGQLSFFEVNNVSYSWDIESGVAVNFDFQNYVVSRHRDGATTSPVDADPSERRVRKKGRNKKVPTEQTPKSVVVDPATLPPPSQIQLGLPREQARRQRRRELRRSFLQAGFSAEDADRLLDRWQGEAP